MPDRLRVYCTECDRGRGIWKRIDENRELLQFLQREAPGLLENFPFIEIWIGNQDFFLMNLLRLMELPLKPEQAKDVAFPRTWPGDPCIGGVYMDFPSNFSKKVSQNERGETTVKETFEGIQKATEEIRCVFEKFHLTQTQAACASACALNQMTSVQEGWPKIATVCLSSALNLKDE